MAAWKVPWTYVVWARAGTSSRRVATRVRIEGDDRGDILSGLQWKNIYCPAISLMRSCQTIDIGSGGER